jgi:arylsulfatase A-like enzyme
MHWPDADRAGHANGWMSGEYEAAARKMDGALGLLTALTEVPRDPGTLLIALSDHGGGGATQNDHDSDHPLDRTIFITIAGGNVRPGPLPDPTSILDVPATILWSLGVAPPANYDGAPLVAAFRHEPEPRPRLERKLEPEQTVAA